ncbi:Protein of unknown function [Paenibacillus uliginis N3/975]|uniref:Uncharacterized protein n=1 Tax=Paenibacillus uliginis N3/975 TaxID=1313296 RepID=A0A1X7HQJ3_9BACL|nr:DUF3888 domain-containing protein [Paenibacillus uliginis]SMF91167.1 Protein of unknown function [Paenibacillus uliginis N3/975]
MRKGWIVFTLILTLFMGWEGSCFAEVKNPQESRELQFQDMLMLFLLPHIEQKLDEVYSSLLTVSPEQYPYFIDIEHVERLNGYMGNTRLRAL